MTNDGSDVVTCLSSETLQTRQAVTKYLLSVTEGPDAGTSFPINDENSEPRMLLGQSPACAVRLSDPHVSRRHAALEVDGRGLRFTDLGSTNGSWVNGVMVLDAILRSGDRVQVGGTVLQVHVGDRVSIPLSSGIRFGKVLGISPEMRRLYPLFERLAASDIAVIIEGETGTGKEALAESIHEMSARSAGPFVVFDCTTITPSLIESALFGHERGAFTGAISSQRGLFEEANGGTLFVDEIGDLELSLQAKLLRAIERSEVRRVGGGRWLRTNARIIAATRRDLDREVQEGRFREDLFFRLSVARVELPPLRRRQGDIAMLGTEFWGEMGGDPAALTAEFMARLQAYHWPGNVRELRNSIAQRLALGDLAEPPFAAATEAQPQAAMGASPAPDFMTQVLEASQPLALARQRVIEEFEKRYVERVLGQHGGHVGRAAQASGIGRRYFQVIRGRGRG
jgi:two-component system, NtrC family, response regulator HydG